MFRKFLVNRKICSMINTILYLNHLNILNNLNNQEPFRSKFKFNKNKNLNVSNNISNSNNNNNLNNNNNNNNNINSSNNSSINKNSPNTNNLKKVLIKNTSLLKKTIFPKNPKASTSPTPLKLISAPPSLYTLLIKMLPLVQIQFYNMITLLNLLTKKKLLPADLIRANPCLQKKSTLTRKNKI